MTTLARSMLLIRDAHGEIIGAQVEHPDDNSGIMTFVSPADAQHTLHRLSDVRAELYDIAHPAEFQKAVNYQARLDSAKITRTSIEELHAAFLGNRFSGKNTASE